MAKSNLTMTQLVQAGIPFTFDGQTARIITARSIGREKGSPTPPKAEGQTYTIVKERKGRQTKQTGTLLELIQYFSYTLEVGKNYERERGNTKINLMPKSIDSLVKNLNAAVANSAANGNAESFYYLE